MEICRMVYEGGEGEIEEKKSRFIATVRPVRTEEEALAFIAELKKKYWNATHNCFAYIVGTNGQICRCSDDGEPQGTSGRPMLEVLQGANLQDVCVVVTRYFGGTLLGTGGLVRAYSKAVSEGLANCRVLARCSGYLLEIGTDYTDIGKLQYLLAQEKIPVLDTQYTDAVRTQALIPSEALKKIREAVTEATSGRAVFGEETEVLYASDGKEAILL